jgi:hypothetical protein
MSRTRQKIMAWIALPKVERAHDDAGFHMPRLARRVQ